MAQSAEHKSFLVPLDGSRLAEAVLPATTCTGQSFSGSGDIIACYGTKAPATIHGERHLTNAAEANSYLEEVASEFACEWCHGGVSRA